MQDTATNRNLSTLLVGYAIMAFLVGCLFAIIYSFLHFFAGFAPSSEERLSASQIKDPLFGIPAEAISGEVHQVTQQHRDGFESGWLLKLADQADSKIITQQQEQLLIRAGYSVYDDAQQQFASNEELIHFLRHKAFASSMVDLLNLRQALTVSNLQIRHYTKHEKQYQHAWVLFDGTRRVMVLLLLSHQHG